MSKPIQRHIKVYAHWDGLPLPVLMGILHVTPSRGKEIFAFDYDPHWIKDNHRYLLDPSLQLVRGLQYAPLGQENFGVFLDSSPDRWGRASKGASYLEIAEFIIQNGSRPTYDLEQLWHRIAFNVCVSNVDDHLRNHGFLLDANGWRLSPAYDMNPDPNGHGLKLNISESDNTQDLALVNDVASYFRIKKDDASRFTQDIVTVVKTWRTEATRLKISNRAQDSMASAFRLALY